MLENPTGFGNPDVRGGSSSFGIPSGRGGVKETCLPSWRCGFFLDKWSHQSVIPWFSIFTPVSASVFFSFGALRLWPSSSSVTKKNNKHLPRKKYTFRRRQTGLWAWSFSYNSKMRRHVWVMFHPVLVESSKLPFIVFSANFKQGKPVRLNMNDHMMSKLRIE